MPPPKAIKWRSIGRESNNGALVQGTVISQCGIVDERYLFQFGLRVVHLMWVFTLGFKCLEGTG